MAAAKMNSQNLNEDSFSVSLPASTSDNQDEERVQDEGSKLLMSPVSKLEYKSIMSRRQRRKLRQTTEIFTIEGSWSEISQNFQDLYQTLLATKTDCFECYQVILNSLENFYQRTSASDSEGIRKLVSAFLEKSFNSNVADEISLTGAICTEKQIVECELRCLLDIYLLRDFPRPLSHTSIVQKLRSLFFASNSERIKKFLNETVCDEFLDDLPLSLAGIYEELFLDAPVDLQRFQSQEQLERCRIQPVQELRERNKFASKLFEFMNECEKAAEESQNPGKKSVCKKKNKRSKNDISKEKPIKRKKRKMSSVSPVAAEQQKRPQARRRLIHVPETPEDKLLHNFRSSRLSGDSKDEAKDTDFVPNTPIGKIRRENLKKTALLELVEKEEHRLMKIDLSAKASCQACSSNPFEPVDLPKELKEVTGAASNKTRSSKGSTSTGPVFKSRPMVPSTSSCSVVRRKAKRKIEFSGFSNVVIAETKDS